MIDDNPIPFEKPVQQVNEEIHGNSKYDPKKNESVTRLCLLGATDDEIADYLGINRTTLYDWKKRHPDFNNAIMSGKIEADALVAESLYNSAKGGDVGASKHWLNNRRPQNWRDKTETKVTIQSEQVFKIGDVELKF